MDRKRLTASRADGADAKGLPCSVKTRYLFGLCNRPALVERSGRWYCWQHDPQRLDEERQARSIRSHKESMAREAALEVKWRRQDLLRTSGVGDLTDQDLEQIVAAGGIWAFLSWRPGETDARVND